MKVLGVLALLVLSASLIDGQEKPLVHEERALERMRFNTLAEKNLGRGSLCSQFFAEKSSNAKLAKESLIYFEIWRGYRKPPTKVTVHRSQIITIIDQIKVLPTAEPLGPMNNKKGQQVAPLYKVRISLEDFMDARPCLPDPKPLYEA